MKQITDTCHVVKYAQQNKTYIELLEFFKYIENFKENSNYK
jgi:hypothetical protein